MKTIIRIFLGFSVFLLLTGSINAQVITGTPPTVIITDISGIPIAQNDAINTTLAIQINAAWSTLLSDANLELAKYSEQEKLAKGFANANLYASRPATLQGYQDYTLFALATGVMLGVQAPAFHIDQDRITKIREDIKNDGDIYAGMSTGIALVNAGINAGFIYPGLYFNFIYGFFSFDGKDFNSDLEGFIYETSLYGVGINYNILWSRTIIPGILRWRGISIGTGFSYAGTKTSIEITQSIDTEAVSATASGYTLGGSLQLDPTFTINIETRNMTIPLDISTSIKFLYVLNFNLGIGVDFNYGYCDIGLEASGEVTANISDSNVTATTAPGSVEMHGGAEDIKASLINPRVTTGIGFNFSVVKIDIPVAIYLDAGFSAGLSAGIVW